MGVVNKTKPRLVVDVSEEFHKTIKKQALELGITISGYIIKALIEKMENDMKRVPHE